MVTKEEVIENIRKDAYGFGRGAPNNEQFRKDLEDIFVYLRGADLRGVHLEGADMGRDPLDGVHLEGADFRGAKLMGASFRCANLEGADFRGARLGFTNFDGADLTGAKIDRLDIIDLALDLGLIDRNLTDKISGDVIDKDKKLDDIIENAKELLEERGVKIETVTVPALPPPPPPLEAKKKLRLTKWFR